jgi:hypothetical protein
MKSTVSLVQEDALSLVVELVHAQVTTKLKDADTTHQAHLMIVITQVLQVVLDYQVSSHMEEMQEVNVSLVVYPAHHPLALLLSVSSSNAKDQELTLHSISN